MSAKVTRLDAFLGAALPDPFGRPEVFAAFALAAGFAIGAFALAAFALAGAAAFFAFAGFVTFFAIVL